MRIFEKMSRYAANRVHACVKDIIQGISFNAMWAINKANRRWIRAETHH
jgi:hypothetical protein